MKLRTIELLRLLLIASLGGPALLLAVTGWMTYRVAFADAESEISRTSEVGREHASKVFDSFRLVTDRVQDVLEGLDDAAIRASEQTLHSRFARIIADLPQIRSFIVLDGDGHPLVATAAYPVSKSENLSDRDYFNALKGAPDAAAYISRVQKSRITGETFFGWGEARRGGDHQFGGVIDIAISPDFFAHFYDSSSGKRAKVRMAASSR
jgi:two-component system, NtrC family, sensor kinase